MNRSQFIAMAKDVKANPAKLAEYRKVFKNVYPFSDGIFKLLMANEAKPERTIKFLNAMLGLEGSEAITEFTLGVQENPGILNDKTAIFDVYGITQSGEPVLIEVQQNADKLFADRLIYYTSRVVSRTVKASQKYELPHIYVLSILTEDLFILEKDTYFHRTQIVRNKNHFYDKLDVYFVELEKFFNIEDRTPNENREKSKRADMLRLFRAVLEDDDISEDRLRGLLDKDFVKDVSLKRFSDEILLNEVDEMTNIAYEKESSYLEGKDDGIKQGIEQGIKQGVSNTKREMAKSLKEQGFPISAIEKASGLSEEEIKSL